MEADECGQDLLLYDGSTPVLEPGEGGTVLAASGFGPDGLRARFVADQSILGTDRHYSRAFDPQGNRIHQQSQDNNDTLVFNNTAWDAYGPRLANVNARTGAERARIWAIR